MTEKKQCSKCKIFRPLHQIEEQNKNCNICLEQRRRYRQKHKEEIKPKAKEYRENHKEEINNKQNVKSECPICQCFVRAYAMSRHEQSLKHQFNLNRASYKREPQDPSEKEIERERKQQTMDYINNTFPSYQELEA